jgi:hypothetical protein
MAIRGPRPASFKNSVAFVLTIVMGVVLGCAWTVAEAIEDKLKGSKRPPASQIDKRS